MEAAHLLTQRHCTVVVYLPGCLSHHSTTATYTKPFPCF